ncbi:MAG: palindromic element RPE1 domain-containing protein [Candidatus Tisiphia sp.]
MQSHRCLASLHFIRPLSKLAYAEEFEGDAERRTTAYLNVISLPTSFKSGILIRL